MKFPPELNFLLQQFHADSFDRGSNQIAVIQRALGALLPEEKRVVKVFLDDLLARPIDLPDLDRQWSASPADIYLGSPKEIPVFFELVRKQID